MFINQRNFLSFLKKKELTELKKQAPQGFGQAMNDFNKQQARQQNIGAVKDMASKVGTGAKDMASKVGTGAKDMASKVGTGIKDFGSKMAGKVGDAVRQRSANQAKQQLGQALTRKAGGDIGSKGFAQAINQFTKQGAKQGAKQAGKQALKQGAKGLAGRAFGALAGGPATAIATALTPSQIGGGENDPEQKFIKEQMARSNRAREMKGQKPGEYVLQNAPEGSGRQAQEKFNAGVDQSLGLKGKKQSTPQKPAKQTQAEFNRSAMEAQVKAGNEPNKFVFDKDTKFKDAFNEARKGGVDEFEWGGKKYHTFHQKELDDKSNTRAAKYRPKAKAAPAQQKAAPQGKTFVDNITGKTRQAPPPGVSEDAPTSAPAQRPSAKESFDPKSFGRTNNKKDITDVERMKAARGEMPASRPSREEIGGLRSEAYNRMNNRIKASRDYQAAKKANNIKAMKNAKAMFESNRPNDEAYNKMKSRMEDNRFQSNRFTDYRPSKKETEAMTRSEDSSIEKLKKHMEKQKTSKKEGV